jgi:hypothetical protein
MFLMFPLDFQTTYYVNKAVSLFGKLLLLHNPRVNKVRVIVKVLIKDLALVPFSLLMTQAGNLFGAEGGSWSIPVYILDGRAVAPEAVGNEDAVPPMNATPHPYELPFLNDIQQHHLNLQVWNQQNADIAWEQNIGEQGNQNQDGWGQWPVEAPVQQMDDYRGISFRAMTGYDGPSMLDGITPDYNTSDNPAAWSPESDFLSDIETAADNVVNGSSAGSLSFSRALGGTVTMEVEAPPLEQDEPNTRTSLHSLILVPVAGFQFTVSNFSAMIVFFSCKIYSKLKCIELADSYFAQDPIPDAAIVGVQFCEFFKDRMTFVAGFSSQFGQQVEDLARNFEFKKLAKALGGGKAIWVGPSGIPGPDTGSCSSFSSQDSEDVTGDMAPTRRRGRPRKQATPQVESQVKRSLRSNSQGYNHQMLPYLPPKTKSSTVKAATPPAVLQVEEMQRIGVEECLIDPSALTVEKLMKQKEDHE